MSPLARTLLALACATLLHSATCSKRKCANTTIGQLPILVRPPVKLHLNFNKTGTHETSVDITNVCKSWPGDYELVYEEITVCNDDGFTLKIDLPKSDRDFSPIEKEDQFNHD